MTRQYVHLTDNLDTARNVARRWRDSTPMLLEIDAVAMAGAGIEFFVSENEVWLVKSVPLRYLKISTSHAS